MLNPKISNSRIFCPKGKACNLVFPEPLTTLFGGRDSAFVRSCDACFFLAFLVVSAHCCAAVGLNAD